MEKYEVEKLSRACVVCNTNTNYNILWHVKEVIPDNIPLPGEFDVVSCPTCGFCFADTTANQNDYDVYYQRSILNDKNFDIFIKTSPYFL